jgi:glycosyltransferase involved in cell wall biosynthesis
MALNAESTYPKSKSLAMQKPLPLSVCMISGAEASRIGRALESVSSLAAEIILVLNAEVTDDTEKIATGHGARVFREPWKGYIAQKNSAADKATKPWILGLDADEVVSEALGEEIQATLLDESRQNGFAAFSFPRRSWYCGRWINHGDWYPDRQTRLWRRGSASWGGLDPHDRLMVNGAVGKLRADLHHYSNESIARQIAKIAPYHEEFVKRHVASGGSAGIFELVVRPAWRFVRAYLIRLGFLDGWQGFYIAALSSFSTLTRYALVRESDRTSNHS